MTQTYDLIVRGGEVANHAGRGMADVGVIDGKIAFVGDLSQASAGEVVDATGLTVLPGVIDTQVHFREPGLEWKVARRFTWLSTSRTPSSSATSRVPVEAPMNTLTPQHPGSRSSSPRYFAFSCVPPM